MVWDRDRVKVRVRISFILMICKSTLDERVISGCKGKVR